MEQPCAVRAGERSKKFVEAFEAVRWKFNCARNRVDQPTKNNFGCQKCTVALEEPLEGVRVFLPYAGAGVRRFEGSVNIIEQDPAKAPSALTAPLFQQKKFVHIAICSS